MTAPLVLSVKDVDHLRTSPALPHLRDGLRAAHYSLNGIREFLKLRVSDAELLSKTAFYSAMLGDELVAERSALGVLIQLFFLGGRASKDVFVHALPRKVRAVFESYALVREADPDLVEATVSLTELESVHFFADKLFRNLGGRRIEMANKPIMPMHASSCELFFRDRADRYGKSLLDIGCGSGCQSLLSAKDCSRVVGFDIDPRAVAFSQLNAALNEIDAEFSVADALSFERGIPYEHICFNADSIPDFRSSSGVLGYEFALRVVGDKLERLLAPNGSCRVWVILFVDERFPSPKELIECELDRPGRFCISVTPLRRSAFSVSAEDLARGAIPRTCYLANDSTDRAILLEFCRASRVREIVAAVVTVRVGVGYVELAKDA